MSDRINANLVRFGYPDLTISWKGLVSWGDRTQKA